MQKFTNGYRVRNSTLACLQEAAECYLIILFEDAEIIRSYQSETGMTFEMLVQLFPFLR